MSDVQPKWQIITKRKVERTLRRLPKDVVKRIRQAIKSLAADPRPLGCKRLVNYRDRYRVRVGD